MKESTKILMKEVHRGKTPEPFIDTRAGVIPVDWKSIPLSEIAEALSEQVGDRVFETMSISAGTGFVNQAEKFGKELSGKQYAKYIVLHKGDFSYNKGNSNRFPQGCIYRLEERDEAAVPNVFESFRIIQGNDDFFNQLFLSGFLNRQLCSKINHGVRDDGLLNLTSRDFYSCEVPFPPIREQEKIAEVLSRCDNLINLQQEKIVELKKLKKFCLQKMFPQNGRDVPEIRFLGFTEAWEQRKFGDIVEKYEDPVPTPHDGYERLGIRSHAKGTFHSYVGKGKELETAQMHRVAAGNFIVNITFGWEHAVAITDENDAGKLVSHRFPQFRFLEGCEPEFFKYVIVDENFRHHLWLASPGGAGRNRVLNLNEMLEYKMTFPGKEEQLQIASFFRNLDHLIALHQRELEEFQREKKALSQSLLSGIVRVSI